MYTQCPHCNTLFQITSAQTQAAGGMVRCCRCGEIFNALDRLYEKMPAGGAAPTDAEGPQQQETVTPPAAGAAAPGTTPLPTVQRRGTGYNVPADPQDTFVGGRTTARRRPQTWLWGLGSALLALLLIAQFTWWIRDKAIWYPEGRFVLERLCAITGCSVPPRRAPQRITILDRDIRSDPEHPGSLLMELTMSNTADHEQPYPLIELQLFDKAQKLVAERRFKPEVYLGDSRRAKGMMPIELPVHIEMRLVDPGEEVTGFRFDFL